MREKSKTTTFFLSLAALGVVYGDIGTSPLYAIRASLDGLPINLTDVLGVLSLIFWALVIVISFKYLFIVFRADNEGEGGVLALLARLQHTKASAFKWLFLIGIFGGGLMLGDGMLTPAISVVSATEGLNVISPTFAHWILPLTYVVLIALFMVQSLGTARIGFTFGPIIFIWFVVLAILGITQIAHNPIVLKAINPYYAVEFFHQNGFESYILLGGVFLAVTGGEALYADLGHFGKNPIRLSWFLVALPGLLCNYFGQGAYLLIHPAAIRNPFYDIAPAWFSVPLLIIAMMATIIASQAVISATFSLTKQAVLLGLYPRLRIIQTSATERGQIYVPQMNIILAIGTLILITVFQNADALAHAYGIAVNLVMILTTVMIIYLARQAWQWSVLKISLLFSWLLLIDLLFLGANLQKFVTGGWLPILFAALCAFIMLTWNKGMQYLRETYYTKKGDLTKMLDQLKYQTMTRIPDSTAIFITDIYDKSGGSFLRFLKMSRTVPENILIVSYTVETIPYVALSNRFELTQLAKDIYQVVLHYGFMDTLNFPQALERLNELKQLPFPIEVEKTLYLVEVPNITASAQKKTLLFFWQEKLFAFLTRNYSVNTDIELFHLPYDRTIALGVYCVV